jgi:hypothetical protein
MRSRLYSGPPGGLSYAVVQGGVVIPEWLKSIWHDPVWSKLIATGIGGEHKCGQRRRHDTYFLHLFRAQSWANSELRRMNGGPQHMS